MNLGGSIRFNKFPILVSLCLMLLIIYVLHYSSRNMELLKIRFEMNYVNLTELLIASIEAAYLGGREVLKTKSKLNVRLKGKTLEGLNDSVTNADFSSHCQMFYSLKNMFPNLNIVSEEKQNYYDCFYEQILTTLTMNRIFLNNGYIRGDSFAHKQDISIWIDPLDATKEYIEGLNMYITTMVCVAIKGRPVIGVIHKPFSNETYWMWIDHGQSNQFLVRKNDTNNIVLISLSHGGNVIEKVHEIFQKPVQVKKAAGAGYKVLEVAVGKASAYVHSTIIKKWDICAGDAIITGLGGKAVTLNNRHVIDYSDPEQFLVSDGLFVSL